MEGPADNHVTQALLPRTFRDEFLPQAGIGGPLQAAAFSVLGQTKTAFNHYYLTSHRSELHGFRKPFKMVTSLLESHKVVISETLVAQQ